MIKVIHVFQSIGGGTGTYLRNVANHQIAAFGEKNVRFVLPASDRVHFPSIPEENIVLFRSSRRDVRSLLDFYKVTVRELRSGRYDIIHLHSTYAGLLRIFWLRGAVVYCPHGWAFSREDGLLLTSVFGAIEKALVPLSKAILCISEHERAVALQRGLKPDKLRVIKNGIDDIFYERNVPGLSINVAFIGRFDRQKGLDIFLGAVGSLFREDIKFKVVGDYIVSDGEVQQETVRENVEMLGWIGAREIARLLSTIDAVVIPSRWEGFGLVAIEAMRAGCAVIASNRGALPELVSPDIGYIFDPGSPNGLLEVLSSVSKSDLIEKGLKARQKYLEFFQATRMNREIELLYAEVADERG